VSRGSGLSGLAAEFADGPALLRAARALREAGYTRLDGHSPQPVEGLAETLGLARTAVPRLALLGGIAGGAGGYLLQVWLSAVDYPLDIGGRPLHSAPSFIVVAFELAILGASAATVLGMLALNRLPMPHHPLFEIPEFAGATRHRFFMSVGSDDPRFDAQGTRRFLQELGARGLWEFGA
jgi:hypothetical protein